MAELLTRGDVEAAGRLREMAEGGERELAKAARRALYLLSQRGVQPPHREVQVEPEQATAAPLLSRALLTNPDGEGRRMLILVKEDAHGGSPTLASILIDDQNGLDDLGARKMSRRQIDENLAEFVAKPKQVVAEIPMDYGRWLLAEAHRTSVEKRKPLPAGYFDLVRGLPEPVRDYSASLVYEALDADAVREDLSISRSPEELFKSDLFDTWFLDYRQVEPWEEKFFESQRTMLTLSQDQVRQRGERIIDEAADELMTTVLLALYRRRLEDTAWVLHLAGREEEARRAMYHALSIDEKLPAHAIPIARMLVFRTIYMVIAIKAEMEPEEAQDTGLIERA